MSFFGKTDVQGIIYLSLALFFSVSLGTYSPLDPSLNTLGQQPIQNYCGYIGSFLSDLFYQGFGAGAFFIVFILIKLSFTTFSGKKILKYQHHVLDLTLLCSICASLSLFLPETRLFQNHITAGGATGLMITHSLIPLFHKTGTIILLASCLICCLIAKTHQPVRYYLQHGFNILKLSLSGTQNVISYFFKNWRKIKSVDLPPITFHSNSEETDFHSEDVASLPEETQEVTAPSLSFQQTFPDEWKKPTVQMLPAIPKNTFRISSQEIHQQTQKLQDKLAQFAVTGEMVDIKSGPAVTLFEFRPADSVKVGKITQLADDLSMALSAESLRIIAPIPGRDVVGIEASNSSREMVYFKELVKDNLFSNHSWELPLVIGRHAEGAPCIQELTQIPHLLVAGSTGSGKSVFITSLLSGLLMYHSPETLRLILVDPKQVDLASFSDIPHLLFPPIVNTSKALDALQWTIREMDKRYRSLNQFQARGIKMFNYIISQLSKEEKAQHESAIVNEKEDYYYEPLPYICIVVEEFGDLMASPKKNQVEQAVVRLAQMARACGIHLILAMQSPRKDVVTGLIKTNIPGRISFKVASKIDSRVILDESGAERLLAKGDMLFSTPGSSKIKRCHGAYMSEEEIKIVVDHWKQQGSPQYRTLNQMENENFNIHSTPWSENAEDTEKYLEIRSYVASLKTVSTSSLQRKFRLGYPRAARMMEKFEEEGIVGPAHGSKPREVLHNK